MDKWPFYRASDSKVGDVMPCYFNDRFYVYYLRFGVYEDGAYNEWSVRETTDFVNFSEDRRVGVFGGTGEIYPLNGKYHLFKEAEPNVIGHFIGDTPYAFEDTGLRLPPDGQYYVDWAWRDPKIFWVEEEQCYWMLVATNQRNRNTVLRHACVGLCKSKDLYEWEYCKPLYAPQAHEGTYECPDMFQMGDWYYLIYSNANYNKTTHYVKSRSIYGPWLMPEDDTIDSFLFYAGRTAYNGEERYIAAWNPERTGKDYAMELGVDDVAKMEMLQYEDFSPFGYAGDMVIHRLGQKKNGDLTCSPVPTVRNCFNKRISFEFHQLQGNQWEINENNASVKSRGRYSCALACKLPECYFCSLKLRVNGHEAGIVLGTDETFISQGLFLTFQPGKGRVNAVSGIRDRAWVGYCLPFAVEQEKFIEPDENGIYNVQIIQAKDIIVLYVNGAALSLRSENAALGNLGFYAYDSDISLTEIEIQEV